MLLILVWLTNPSDISDMYHCRDVKGYSHEDVGIIISALTVFMQLISFPEEGDRRSALQV